MEIYLSFGISLLASFDDNYFERNSFGDFFEEIIILSAILLSIKFPVAFAVFSIALFEVVFIAPVADFIALSTSFLLYLLLMLLSIFLAKDKNP